MTITTNNSSRLTDLKNSSSSYDTTDKQLLDQLIKNKQYHNFFDALEAFDTTKKGTKTLLAKKIRKLDFEELVKNPELTTKLILTLVITHPTLIDKQILQRGLINKLKKAIKSKNTLAQLVCLKLINTIKNKDLQVKLEKTHDEQTVDMIRDFKSLCTKNIQFLVKHDLTISVQPEEVGTEQLIKIQQFLATFQWNQICLNLENDKPQEQKLNDNELKRLLMILKKDSSPYISVKFKGQNLTPSLMKDLVNLLSSGPKITKLNLKDCHIDYDCLKQLVKIWDHKKDPLIALNLANNPLKNKGIKLLLGKIPASTQLSMINLQSTRMNTNALTDLSQHLIARTTPLHLKLSKLEVEKGDRVFLNFMCNPIETIEFIKPKDPPTLTEEPPPVTELKKPEKIIPPSDKNIEEVDNAKIYDGKTQTLREATEKDFETFDAVYLPDRDIVETSFTSEVLDTPDETILIIENQGIPSENMRILIEENQIMILGYWTIYNNLSSGYESLHEYYYEVLEYLGNKLKPETFTFEQIDESTLQFKVKTERLYRQRGDIVCDEYAPLF